MSDGTSTQVRVQIVNKCKTTMASRRLYRKGSPHEEADGEKKKKEYCSNTNNHNLQTVTDIYLSYLLGLRIYGY